MDYQNLDNASKDGENLQDDDVELSDVIEVIQTDPEFRVPVVTENREMFNGGGEILVPRRAAPAQAPQQSKRQQAYIKIVEQPAPKALRFRYECEGRSAGSIPGTNSTPENKTYPTIQIVGYQGKAVVVVSCVTKDNPHKPHPHNLVGREGCRRGVCTLEIPVDTMTVQFSNLGIQCVKKKEIENALRTREEIRVDPFRTGFAHRNQPTSIDLNTVRLCFQVFLEGDTPGKFTVPLKPVVSEPIYDKKAMSDLSIIKLSDCVSPVDGGQKDIILLCEKVAKEDIQIRFYEETSDWEAFADFQPSQVHKQHAIWFKTPRYKTLDVTEPVKVFIQLRRPSDGATSESLPFEMWPSYLLNSEPLKRKEPKRQKIEDLRSLEGSEIAGGNQFGTPCFSISTSIKPEPRGSPSPYGGSVSPYGGSVSSFGGAASPLYAPNISASPQVQIWDSPAPMTLQPPTTATQYWNITGAELANPMSEQNDLLNLDSGEIKRLVSAVDSQHSLPDLNLSFSDIMPAVEQANSDINMTDSLTKFTNMALNEFYQNK
nr:embryonic polarity protein dorsal-like isoform X2 [Leptinotarsa decemlineata]